MTSPFVHALWLHSRYLGGFLFYWIGGVNSVQMSQLCIGFIFSVCSVGSNQDRWLTENIQWTDSTDASLNHFSVPKKEPNRVKQGRVYPLVHYPWSHFAIYSKPQRYALSSRSPPACTDTSVTELHNAPESSLNQSRIWILIHFYVGLF